MKLKEQRAFGCDYYLCRDRDNKHLDKPALAALGNRIDLLLAFSETKEIQDAFARRASERGWHPVFRHWPDADMKGIHAFYKKHGEATPNEVENHCNSLA